MPNTDAITIIKRFTYRGVTEEWSNTYHLTGTTPGDDAEWKTLADAVAASEKGCYLSSSKIVRAYGYNSSNPEVAVSVIDYTGLAAEIPGTYTQGTGLAWAGDQAGWIRVRAAGLSVKGKPVYLRKYFHDGVSSPGTPDSLNTTIKAAYIAHANKMIGGTLPGGMKWCGPQGGLATLPIAATWVTTRTLKRRGRRPTPAP